MPLPRVVEITLHTSRPLCEESAAPLSRLTPLGLVVSEHADKIGFFEPAVEIIDKEISAHAVRITLRVAGTLEKPVGEIVRGFKVGCFKIAREYGLISPKDKTPIFLGSYVQVAQSINPLID